MNSRPCEWPVRARRVALGLSLADLCLVTGMDTAHLELIERRTGTASPKLAELEKIAEVLGIPVEELRG